jgi:hypothetical protein
MTLRKKLLIGIISIACLITLLFGAIILIWNTGIDDVHSGLQEGITRSAASDSPIELPINATDIYYAYELYWQGGCMIARYNFPQGDLKKQAKTHLRSVVPWVTINSTELADVPEHRFESHAWFQPIDIASGYESSSSGMLWEPKVWIDEASRTIYVLDQN